MRNSPPHEKTHFLFRQLNCFTILSLFEIKPFSWEIPSLGPDSALWGTQNQMSQQEIFTSINWFDVLKFKELQRKQCQQSRISLRLKKVIFKALKRVYIVLLLPIHTLHNNSFSSKIIHIIKQPKTKKYLLMTSLLRQSKWSPWVILNLWTTTNNNYFHTLSTQPYERHWQDGLQQS